MAHDCPHCDRDFPSRRAREDHVDRAHPDAGEPRNWTPILLGALVVLAAGAVGAAVLVGDSGEDGGLHVRDSPRTGDDNASVQMIAFESPACTSCRLFHVGRGGEASTFERVLEDYVRGGEVLYVEKFSRAGYPWGRIGANAQRCAWELGGWEAFKDLTQAYYTSRDQIDRSNAERFANRWASRSNLVDGGSFSSCFEDRRYNDKLGRDLADASRIGVSGTPTFLIRATEGDFERRIVGPQPYSTFANTLDTALAATGASNATAASGGPTDGQAPTGPGARTLFGGAGPP